MNWEQFVKALRKGNIAPAYLFTGDDRYLKAKSIEQLKGALFPKGKGEVLRYQAPEEITSAVRDAKTYSFFSTQRLIILENVDAVAEHSRKLLEPLLKDPSPLAILALVTAEDAECPRWIRQQTITVDCSATPTDIRRWIHGWFKRQGLRASPAVVTLLAQRSGGRFGSLVPDLEKIALLCSPGGTVTRQVAEMASLDHSEEEIFGLTGALLTGNRARGIQVLEDLLRQGQPSGHILTMLAKSLKLRWALTDAPPSREDGEIAAAMKLSARWVAAARRRGEKAAPQLAQRLWDALNEADERLKTSVHNESLVLLAGLAPAFASPERKTRATPPGERNRGKTSR